eukprot:9412335-Alexandrium_andersonii.AAC.1
MGCNKWAPALPAVPSARLEAAAPWAPRCWPRGSLPSQHPPTGTSGTSWGVRGWKPPVSRFWGRGSHPGAGKRKKHWCCV